jgi:hypothetical protein
MCPWDSGKTLMSTGIMIMYYCENRSSEGIGEDLDMCSCDCRWTNRFLSIDRGSDDSILDIMFILILKDALK